MMLYVLVFLVSTLRSTCPANLILLDLIKLYCVKIQIARPLIIKLSPFSSYFLSAHTVVYSALRVAVVTKEYREWSLSLLH